MYSGNVDHFKLIGRQSSCCKITVAGIIEESHMVDQLEISQNTLPYTVFLTRSPLILYTHITVHRLKMIQFVVSF